MLMATADLGIGGTSAERRDGVAKPVDKAPQMPKGVGVSR